MQAQLSGGSALVFWLVFAGVVAALALALLLVERFRTPPPPVRRYPPGGRRAASDPGPTRPDGYVSSTESTSGSYESSCDTGSSDSGGDSGGGCD